MLLLPAPKCHPCNCCQTFVTRSLHICSFGVARAVGGSQATRAHRQVSHWFLVFFLQAALLPRLGGDITGYLRVARGKALPLGLVSRKKRLLFAENAATVHERQ